MEDEEYKKEALDEDEAAQYLSAGGVLSRSPMFEERAGQIGLLRHIVRAFNTDSIGVFEAGTGVGKSYAYLIPSMLWAALNNERVVISTGTITLQEQLFNKDIPAALRIIGKDIKAALLKGRNNYVCLRRLADAQVLFLSRDANGSESELFGDKDAAQLEKIIQWAHSEDTITGSRSELSFVPSSAVWQRVRSESEACLAGHCPFRQSCFVSKARHEAHEAKIVVINHHLLFADAEARLSGVSYDDDAVLPAFHRLIIDEAHLIEDSATSFFSDEVSRYSLGRAISALYHKKGRKERGYLLRLSSAATEAAAEEVRKGAARARKAIDALEDEALKAVKGSSIRLHDGTRGLLCDVLKQMADTSCAIMSFVQVARALLKAASDEEKEVPQWSKEGVSSSSSKGNEAERKGGKAEYKGGAYWEAKLIVQRISDAAAVLSCFPDYGTAEGKQSVFYLESRGEEHRFIVFHKTPLDAAPKISRGVFEPLSSVVCTSATLSIAGDMSYWIRLSGASLSEGERLLSASFPSPFPYKTNCLVAVPSDSPLPNDKGFGAYTSNALIRLLEASGGRALVLFTSYEALRSAAHDVAQKASLAGSRILCQGDDDNARLLQAFKADTASVLFATDSFWQGVDVAGESLSMVVIVKLPFSVPDDPVFVARAEAIEEAGGNSFMQMSVPQAVIKFRQGFGRLIRRKDDRGAVVILDRRVAASRYGSIFMASIPMTRRLLCPLDSVSSEVKYFLR